MAQPSLVTAIQIASGRRDSQPRCVSTKSRGNTRGKQASRRRRIAARGVGARAKFIVGLIIGSLALGLRSEGGSRRPIAEQQGRKKREQVRRSSGCRVCAARCKARARQKLTAISTSSTTSGTAEILGGLVPSVSRLYDHRRHAADPASAVVRGSADKRV
jgi:hypothetical protein